MSFALYFVVYLYILCNAETKLFLGFELINFISRVKELQNFISEYHFFRRLTMIFALKSNNCNSRNFSVSGASPFLASI